MLRRVLSRHPRIVSIDAFLRADECTRLRELGEGRMSACELSEVAHASRHERSSTGCWLPRGDASDLLWAKVGASHADAELVASVEHRIAEELGIPAIHGEPTQVLRYKPGQQYETHPDFFDPRDRDELANGGQRVRTCLIYLSTVPEECGGATAFPELGLRVQPVEGRALMWHNVKANGAIDPATVHAGELVIRGRGRQNPRHTGPDDSAVLPRTPTRRRAHVEKWVLSKWIRERPFTVDLSAGF